MPDKEPRVPTRLPTRRSSQRRVSTHFPAAPSRPNWLRRFYQALGPGFVTGASDDDPSGIGTYAITGAAYGFTALWTAWVTFPLMTAVQYICARIGMVSGTGLAGVLRTHYPRWVLYPMLAGLVVANTLNAGVDIGAIAAAINLLVPAIPITWMVAPLAIGILLVQIFGAYRQIARVLKILAFSLLAYIGSAFLSHPDWAAVAKGTLVPQLPLHGAFLATLVAILGTTISPYLFFWQADQEVEEEIEQGRCTIDERRGATDPELKSARTDVMAGMGFSNLVMFFIILATGATLHPAGITHISSAAEAAQALRPLAGDAAEVLLALGLVGTGLMAVPILTASAAFAVCEAFEWGCGLEKRLTEARKFYGFMTVLTLVGMLVNFLGINPIDALFWTAVINGFIAPPMLIVIMRVANDRRVMGERVNGPWLNVLGWAAAGVMAVAAAVLVLTWGRA